MKSKNLFTDFQKFIRKKLKNRFFFLHIMGNHGNHMTEMTIAVMLTINTIFNGVKKEKKKQLIDFFTSHKK